MHLSVTVMCVMHLSVITHIKIMCVMHFSVTDYQRAELWEFWCFAPATHCNTRQHTATHCNTLQHTATQCNTLQHVATHCNTLRHIATHCNTLQHIATHCTTLHHIAPYCTILHNIATHCNTLQKSPIFIEPPAFPQKALHFHKRALYLLNSPHAERIVAWVRARKWATRIIAVRGPIQHRTSPAVCSERRRFCACITW